MKLVLGTVQFGLAYGIAGRGRAVPEVEVRDILARAWDLGIRELDTAAAYGDIEGRLPALMGGREFAVVTKLPPAPVGLQPHDAAQWCASALLNARQRLGKRLGGVMFHRAEDLLEPAGQAFWATASRFGNTEGVRVGVSCYGPDTLATLQRLHPGIGIAQLPANAFDQRLAETHLATGALQLHARSAFLQGLLLMPPEQAARRLPAAGEALAAWQLWLQTEGVAALQGALDLLHGLPGVTHVVVGVDNATQLQAIAEAFAAAQPRRAPQLALQRPEVIDPRQWKVAA